MVVVNFHIIINKNSDFDKQYQPVTYMLHGKVEWRMFSGVTPLLKHVRSDKKKEIIGPSIKLLHTHTHTLEVWNINHITQENTENIYAMAVTRRHSTPFFIRWEKHLSYLMIQQQFMQLLLVHHDMVIVLPSQTLDSWQFFVKYGVFLSPCMNFSDTFQLWLPWSEFAWAATLQLIADAQQCTKAPNRRRNYSTRSCSKNVPCLAPAALLQSYLFEHIYFFSDDLLDIMLYKASLGSSTWGGAPGGIGSGIVSPAIRHSLLHWPTTTALGNCTKMCWSVLQHIHCMKS